MGKWCGVATLTLGSWPRQGLVRLWDKKEAREAHLIHSGVQESVREWTLTLLSELPLWELESWWTSEFSRNDCKGSKPIGLKSSLYHWKAIELYMFKMGSHDPFGHLEHKLWLEERLGVKLTMWLPTIKSQESTQFSYVQVACTIPLERSRPGLQLCFRSHLNQRSAHKVMGPQSCKSPNCENFGTPTWES